MQYLHKILQSVRPQNIFIYIYIINIIHVYIHNIVNLDMDQKI